MKAFLLPASLAVGVALLVGCGDGSVDKGTGPEPVPQLDSILTLEPSEIAPLLGESVQLTATLLDPDSLPITSFGVAYTVLDPAVATVGPGGAVTGLGSGQTSVIGTVGSAADTVPVTVPMAFSVISAGASTCGVTTAGQARCWGWGSQGELGADRDAPRPVTPAGDLVYRLVRTSPAGDSTFTCGVTVEGATYCWGNNTRGQLGTGDQVSSMVPRRTMADQVFADLDLGAAHACGMTGSGEVFCWGANDSGQLGTGDSVSSSQPVAVQGDLPFVSISLGYSYSCALLEGGSARCWGDNTYGQLGTGDTLGSPVPAPVEGSHQFSGIDAGALHTCGIATTGDAFCWGNNSSGQVGNGLFVFEPVLAPSLVVGGHNWRVISAGAGFNCGITVEGPTYCWGIASDGTLGNDYFGTASPFPTPQLVAGNHTFTDISSGGDHTCAISAGAGQPLFCWGRNNRGQLDGYPNYFMIAFSPRLTTGF